MEEKNSTHNKRKKGKENKGSPCVSYLPAEHEFIAVVDMSWSSTREDPGQRQAGGATLVQVDGCHSGGIWGKRKDERRK